MNRITKTLYSTCDTIDSRVRLTHLLDRWWMAVLDDNPDLDDYWRQVECDEQNGKGDYS